jgi:hypothetical protein
VRRTTLRKLVAIAAAFAVGLGLGAGGVWALGGTQQGGDTPATITSYEVVRNDLGGLEIRFWVTTGSNPNFTLWHVEQDPDRVVVSVRERWTSELRPLDAVFTRLSWPLWEPVGTRRVVDASTGKDIPPLE